jgi:hypothetical protein
MTYEDKKKRLRDTVNTNTLFGPDGMWVCRELEKAWSALDKMRSALEFYADERNYERYWVDGITDSCKVEEDEGKKAREALND